MSVRISIPALAAVAATATLTAPPLAPAIATRTLNATAELKRTSRPGPNQAIQSGPIKGSPFGSGTMTLRSRLKRATVTSTFTVRTARGTVTGSARARLTLDGDDATYRGTATIRRGSGFYRNIKATKVSFLGKGPVSAKKTTIKLTGRLRY